MEQIISRTAMRARGAAAFNKDQDRESHGLSPLSSAIDDWLAGFDEAAMAAYCAGQRWPTTSPGGISP